MVQTISTSLSTLELTDLIDNAVTTAIDRKLSPPKSDELLTTTEAAKYLRCSSVFLWKKRKEGLIKTVNAGTKVLFPKSSLIAFLQITKEVSNG